MTQAGADTTIPDPDDPQADEVLGALGEAARRALPLVEGRRGAPRRDTRIVARRLSVAAIDLFAAHGFDDVTVGDIADRAKVNRRTFFRYFPNKETIVVDILDQTNALLVALIDGMDVEPDMTPADVLRQAVIAWIDRYELLLVGLGQLGKRSPTVAAATTIRSVVWEGRIAEALCRRFPDYDPDRALMWSAAGMAAMRLAWQGDSPLPLPEHFAHLLGLLRSS